MHRCQIFDCSDFCLYLLRIQTSRAHALYLCLNFLQIHKYKVIERPNVCYIFIGTVWIQRKRIRIQKTTDPDPKDNGSGSNDNEYGSTDNGSDKTGLNTTKDMCIVHRVNFRKFPNWRESLPIQRFSLHILVLTWAFGVKILFWQCPFESGLCILWASLCF